MAFNHTVADNITLARGKLYFSPFATGTTTPAGHELYLGNTPGFSLSGSVQKLDHFTADTAVRQKDKSVTIESNYTGSVTVDNMSDENLAKFFMGSTSTVTAASATGKTESHLAVPADAVIQLGRTTANPAGDRKVSNVAITGKGLGTDYTIDADLGLIHVLVAGDYAVTYDVAASTRSRVISAGTEVRGLLHFIADYPVGTNRDMVLPSVTIAPNGDLSLKGDGTAWQQMQFNLEVLVRDSSTPAVIIDGRAV